MTPRSLAWWAIVLAGAIVAIVAFFSSKRFREGPKTQWMAASAQQIQLNCPNSFNDLLALRPDQVANTDIALMNLLCAEGLPDAESLNTADALQALDQWAQYIKSETDRSYHRYQEDPQYFYNSSNFYKILIMAVVVYENFGVRYSLKWIAPPAELQTNDHFFADSRDVFIHGLLGPNRMGTCSSMPVLYIALGRRLGYPLKLVTTKQHLFVRWDGPTERFNFDATGKGVEKLDDDYFRHWPFSITDSEIANEGHLKSLSSAEELAVFLSIRAACLTEAHRFKQAFEARRAAVLYAPNWQGNKIMLHQALRSENEITPTTAAEIVLHQ